jgi:hypothetical protein
MRLTVIRPVALPSEVGGVMFEKHSVVLLDPVVADALNTALFAPIACALLTLTTAAEAGDNLLLSIRGHDYHRPRRHWILEPAVASKGRRRHARRPFRFRSDMRAKGAGYADVRNDPTL